MCSSGSPWCCRMVRLMGELMPPSKRLVVGSAGPPSVSSGSWKTKSCPFLNRCSSLRWQGAPLGGSTTRACSRPWGWVGVSLARVRSLMTSFHL